MKRFTLFILGILTIAFGASAQIYSSGSILNSETTAIVTANITSNYSTAAFTIDVRKQRTLGLILSSKLTGTGTDVTTFTFERSLDNSTWDALHTFAVGLTNNGATAVTYGTNITLNGFGWVRLKTIVNADGGDVLTNIVVKYAIKQAD